MGYHDILAKFFEMFPSYIEKVKAFTPQKGRCIKLELVNHQKLLFTFKNDREWQLCTV